MQGLSFIGPVSAGKNNSQLQYFYIIKNNSNHNTSSDLIQLTIRALLFGKIIIWYAIVSSANIPPEYRSFPAQPAMNSSCWIWIEIIPKRNENGILGVANDVLGENKLMLWES